MCRLNRPGGTFIEVVGEGRLDVTHGALLKSQLLEAYLFVGVFVEDEL